MDNLVSSIASASVWNNLRHPMHRIAATRKATHKAQRQLLAACFFFLAVLPSLVGAGLSVDEQGQLLLQGVPFRGIGVNYYDAFTRTLSRDGSTNYNAGFRELAVRRIPFARFSAGGYWPQDWALYQTNRAEYFSRLDGVVKSAECHGVGLIPSCFWQLSTCRTWWGILQSLG